MSVYFRTVAYSAVALLPACRGPFVTPSGYGPNQHSIAGCRCASRVSEERQARPEDAYASLADQVRGFAGLYFRGDTLVLMLVDTTRRVAAEAATRPLVAGRPYNTVDVERVDYDARQLKNWKTLARRAWSRRMTALAIDTPRNRLVVGVLSRRDVSRVRTRLAARGVPPAALVVEVFSPPAPT